jgi:hypothetical protein
MREAENLNGSLVVKLVQCSVAASVADPVQP